MKRKQFSQKRKFYRTNHFIQAKEVRVIDEEGKQIGVLPLSKALAEAQDQGLDLVEIAPKAQPPVCKIIDFKKFKYLEAKKEKAGKKSKKTEIKEVRLTPFIAENDLKNRIEKTRAFLKDKNQVKISVQFKGRQIAKKDFGYKIVDQVTQALADCAQVIQEPKFIGRRLILTLTPNEKSKKDQTQDQKVSQKKV